MSVWRINLLTDAIEGVDPANFCIERNIIGIGWRLEPPPDQEIDQQTYLDRVSDQHDDKGWRLAADVLMNRIQCGDLCWTKSGGINYLARVSGQWEYRATANQLEYVDADVSQVRECEYFRVGGPDSIPGDINFRGQTLNQVRSPSAIFYSKYLYNELSNNPIFELQNEPELNFWELMSWYDCEDIIGIYLQEELGYRIIPSTVKINTPRTEFVARTENSKAHVQIKSGVEPLNRDNYEFDFDDPCVWYLFSSTGNYCGDEFDHIVCLDPDLMEEFARNNLPLMSFRIRKFIEFLDEWLDN